MKYKETQIGWLIIGMMIFSIVFFLLFSLFQLGDNSMPLEIAFIMMAVFLVVLSLFYKLTIIVSNDFIEVSFGLGLISKQIKITDIKSIKRVKTKWYNGWGIKVIKNGWLYNIQGFHALELSFKASNKRIIIGTKHNSNLEREIKRLLTSYFVKKRDKV